jgi:hypothetical protein
MAPPITIRRRRFPVYRVRDWVRAGELFDLTLLATMAAAFPLDTIAILVEPESTLVGVALA